MKIKITAAGDVLKSIFDLIVYLRKSSPNTIGSWRKIVKTNHRSLLSDITTKFNEGRTGLVSKRTIQYNLHIKHNYRRSVVKKKLVIKDVNRKKRLAWCRGKRIWTVDNWKGGIFPMKPR